MIKRRDDSSQEKSNKKLKATCIYHEFLSRANANHALAFQKSNVVMKDESNESIKQRLRQSILKNRRREKRERQIESDVEEKRKSKKQYSQKFKTIRDRARMIRYSNEKKIIAQVKNVDRAA